MPAWQSFTLKSPLLLAASSRFTFSRSCVNTSCIGSPILKLRVSWCPKDRSKSAGKRSLKPQGSALIGPGGCEGPLHGLSGTQSPGLRLSRQHLFHLLQAPESSCSLQVACRRLRDVQRRVPAGSWEFAARFRWHFRKVTETRFVVPFETLQSLRTYLGQVSEPPRSCASMMRVMARMDLS